MAKTLWYVSKVILNNLDDCKIATYDNGFFKYSKRYELSFPDDDIEEDFIIEARNEYKNARSYK